MDLRLASYNVFGFPWCNTPIREIVEWITGHCDIIALQEVWCRHSAWSAAFMERGWTFLRPARENQIIGLFGSGLAFAWRNRDWRLRESRCYPFLVGTGFDQFATKGWFRVELTERRTGRPLRLINLHLQSDFEICLSLMAPYLEAIRMSQIHQMIEVERSQPMMDTFFIGDWNTERCWLSTGWLGGNEAPTYPALCQSLDHCVSWTSHWSLIGHTVPRITLSDHHPVIWTVRPSLLEEQRLAQRPRAQHPPPHSPHPGHG